jgi:transposase
MRSGNFTDEFKRDAVAQITERGYPVAEVSKRLGVSQHSLYAWRRKFSKPSVSTDDDQAAEIRHLKKELARVTEERDILKKATVSSTDQRNGLLQHMGWRSVAKSFPRPRVELKSNGVEVILAIAR